MKDIISDPDVLFAREFSKMISTQNKEETLQGILDKSYKETFGSIKEKLDQDLKLSDEEFEWITGHPNYWKRANPF